MKKHTLIQSTMSSFHKGKMEIFLLVQVTMLILKFGIYEKVLILFLISRQQKIVYALDSLIQMSLICLLLLEIQMVKFRFGTLGCQGVL